MTTRSVPRGLLFLTVLFPVLLFAVFMPTCEAKEAVPGETPKITSSPSKDYVSPFLLAGQADLEDPDMVLVDARHPDDYKAGHIPGAIVLWWKDFGDPNLLGVVRLDKILGRKGLSENRKIVVYDDAQSSKGVAARIFWMLEYLGCKNVRILNGGWCKWLADGRPAEKAINSLPPATFSAKPEPGRLANKDFIAKRTPR